MVPPHPRKAPLLTTTALLLVLSLVAPPIAAVPDATPIRVGVAGDIADPARLAPARATARLLRDEDLVLTAGDNVYDHGSAWEYAHGYDPTWGQVLRRTRPSPGNHDYHQPGAAAYFDYFGARAGTPGRGYYSFVRRGWRFVALNSEIAIGAGSRQHRWLRRTLASSSEPCTLAYWHRPRLSTGLHGDDASVDAVFGVLYEHRAELVVNGHDHQYQRWYPLDDGLMRARDGVQEFVVGTGGSELYPFVRRDPRVAARASRFGILELSLWPTSYAWRFRDARGVVRDAGSRACV